MRRTLLACALLGACAPAPPPAVRPVPAVAEECVPQPFPEGGLFPPRERREWKSDRRESEFAELRLQVTPCVEPGGELRIAADATGRAGIGCWDGAGIEMHCLTGRGVLVENEAPRIVAMEGGEATGAGPHFESAVGPWGIFMKRRTPFGPGHRMRYEAVARIVPDARPRELTLDFEVSAHRNEWDTYVFHGVSMKRTVRTRIAAGCD